MLAHAEQRGCYNKTTVVDLNQPPFSALQQQQQAAYDIITCIGTLTYVNPAAGTLPEFVRLVAPGGLVCVSHRTDQVNAWETVQTSLEDQAGAWKLEKVGPLPYLPQHPDSADNNLIKSRLYLSTKCDPALQQIL